MKKWIIYIALGILIVTLLISLSAQMRRASAAETILHETTLSALAEAAEETQGLALALDKLLVCTSDRQATSLLGEIILRCDRVHHSLSGLSVPQSEIAPVLSYLSSLDRLAQAHLDALMAEEPTPQNDRSAFTAMQRNMRLLYTELDLARKDMLTGASLAEAMPQTAITNAPTAEELVSYRALPSQEIGTGMALQIAKEFVGADRVVEVSHAPDTSGALPTFGVTVQTADVQLNLEVTQRGGKVLMMVPETASFETRRTVAECRAAAAAFLESRGFISMSPTYYQLYDGLCVLTFVHEQDEVLVWSDRVMVQVRMDTAEVVGIEARSYWQNHQPRRMDVPLLTESEASAALSPYASDYTSRLALLPVNGQERLCWQFTFTAMDDTYISYVDCFSGREVLLEKVMQLDAGSLAA